MMGEYLLEGNTEKEFGAFVKRLNQSFQDILQEYLSDCLTTRIPIDLLKYRNGLYKRGIVPIATPSYIDIGSLYEYQKMFLYKLLEHNSEFKYYIPRGRS